MSSADADFLWRCSICRQVADQDDAPTYSAIEQVYKCIVPAILGGIQFRPFHPKKWRNVNSIFIIYMYNILLHTIYIYCLLHMYIYICIYSFKQLSNNWFNWSIHLARGAIHQLFTPNPQHHPLPGRYPCVLDNTIATKFACLYLIIPAVYVSKNIMYIYTYDIWYMISFYIWYNSIYDIMCIYIYLYIHIWINYHNSLTWKVRPSWDTC